MATGCTEPGAVALAVAKACSLLDGIPDSIELLLSKNVYKNAMGVGIPGTGMSGLPIAVAVAATAGRPERGLEVLSVSAEETQAAKQWLSCNMERIHIGIKDCSERLYIECRCEQASNSSKVVIAHKHTGFVFISKNDKVLLDDCSQQQGDASQNTSPCEASVSPALSVAVVYEYATTTPIDELRFILDTTRLNEAAATEGLKGYGLNAGRILMECAGEDIVHRVVASTVAASDARMDGCTLPIYSNSGSGNQGITCTVPVCEYAQLTNCSEERLTRALILSHLMSIYVKQGIGRLSALCGIVNASLGVASAITYLKGGTLTQITYAIKNLINTITGMICDGAKPSCALKISAGLYSAFVASDLACNDFVVDATDGISESCVECSIKNLVRLGHDGMCQTDDMILDIMTHKQTQ